jgi:hypothetical protein
VEAIKREVLEETNLTVQTLKVNGHFNFYEKISKKLKQVPLFLTYVTGSNIIPLNKDEIIDFQTISLDVFCQSRGSLISNDLIMVLSNVFLVYPFKNNSA